MDGLEGAPRLAGRHLHLAEASFRLVDALPSYADLPITPGAPAGSSWGLWGAEDRFGCLNLLTPERAAAAL